MGIENHTMLSTEFLYQHLPDISGGEDRQFATGQISSARKRNKKRSKYVYFISQPIYQD